MILFGDEFYLEMVLPYATIAKKPVTLADVNSEFTNVNDPVISLICDGETLEWVKELLPDIKNITELENIDLRTPVLHCGDTLYLFAFNMQKEFQITKITVIDEYVDDPNYDNVTLGDLMKYIDRKVFENSDKFQLKKRGLTELRNGEVIMRFTHPRSGDFYIEFTDKKSRMIAKIIVDNKIIGHESGRMFIYNDRDEILAGYKEGIVLSYRDPICDASIRNIFKETKSDSWHALVMALLWDISRTD